MNDKPKRTQNGGPLTNNPQVPMTFPEPVEIADAVLTASDIEKMKKAEEKRMRKRMKSLDGMAKIVIIVK